MIYILLTTYNYIVCYRFIDLYECDKFGSIKLVKAKCL